MDVILMVLEIMFEEGKKKKGNYNEQYNYTVSFIYFFYS